MRHLQALVDGLTDQNHLLRHQVAQLGGENAQLCGVPRGTAVPPAPEIQPATSPREPQRRKKRDPSQNAGRRRLPHATRWEAHAIEQCPGCGTALQGGWIVRRVQVIDLPPVAPCEITEHRIIRRRCTRCGKHIVPEPVGLEAGRIGRCRFGPRLIAAITTMATVERLPGRMIQDRVKRDYGLTISHGGIIGLLARMAGVGQEAYDQIGRLAVETGGRLLVGPGR